MQDLQLLTIAPQAMPADQNPARLYMLNNLTTAASRGGMVSNLKRAVRVLSQGHSDDIDSFPWHLLRAQHVARMRAIMLEEGVKPKGVNTVLYGVKGVLAWCFDLGQLDAGEFAAIQRVKPAKNEATEPAGRCLSQGEVNALVSVCAADKSPAGRRDTALFALAFSAGLRRAELCSLTIGDWTPAEADGVGVLKLVGKGHKARTVYVGNGAALAVRDWLVARQEGSQGWAVTGNSALLTPIYVGGHLRDHAISAPGIVKIMAGRAQEAGVAAFSPHDCRRTYCSGLLDAGVDISTAARLMGHSSTDTTRTYDRRGERAAQEAAGSIHFPYAGLEG